MLGNCVSVIPKPGGTLQSVSCVWLFFLSSFFKDFAWGFCLDHFGLKPGNQACYMNGWCPSPCHLLCFTSVSPTSHHGFMVGVPYSTGRRAWVYQQGFKWAAITLLPLSRVALGLWWGGHFQWAELQVVPLFVCFACKKRWPEVVSADFWTVVYILVRYVEQESGEEVCDWIMGVGTSLCWPLALSRGYSWYPGWLVW